MEVSSLCSTSLRRRPASPRLASLERSDFVKLWSAPREVILNFTHTLDDRQVGRKEPKICLPHLLEGVAAWFTSVPTCGDAYGVCSAPEID